MTIMLLPGDKILVLATKYDTREYVQIAQALQNWLDDPKLKAVCLNNVKLVIDARSVPAIAIEVPK